MSKIQENKTLANLIKADLKDALENDSRWKISGLSHFFHEYWVWWDKEMWIHTKNEVLKKELEKNRIKNQAKREEVEEQERKKIEKETGKSWVNHWEGEKKDFHENIRVMRDELDLADWEEIINLINQIQPLKEKKDHEKKQKVYEKLNSKKGLVYWSGHGKRMSGSDDYGREWYHFDAEVNGREFLLNIPKNHPALDNFPFDQEGFYLAEGVDYNTNVITREYWDTKDVNLTEIITITPYNDEETVNFAFKNNADKNKVEEENRKNFSNSGNNNLMSGSKSQSIIKEEKKQENSELEKVKEYFIRNDIKKITQFNGKLVVEHNNGEIIPFNQLTNGEEDWEVLNYYKKQNSQELSRKELGIETNIPNNNTQSENKYLWLAGGIAVVLIVYGVLVFARHRKKVKNS